MTDAQQLRSISVQGVSRTFEGGVHALHNVSLEISAGSLTVLVGPSGCGKTTLLRILGGLDAPTRGSVTYVGANGRTLTPAHAGVAIGFQEPRLLPWRTVCRNIELPLELRGVSNPERMDRAMEMASLVDLRDAVWRVPSQLSGGMRMRAAIARALVTEPGVLLLDEPFGSLDEITRAVLDDLLLRLWAKTRTTVVLVTHSITEAVYLGQRVVVLSRGPGQIVDEVRPEFGAQDMGPNARAQDLRVTAEFAAVTARVHQALARGMAGAA